VVAETLGVSVDQCRMMITSTEKNHNTSATAASSGSDLNAMAAHLATLKIKDRLLNLAAQIFKGEQHDAHFEYSYQEGLATDHIVIEDNVVINRQTQKTIPLTELLSTAYLHRISLGDYAFYRTPELSYDPATGKGHPFNYYTNGVAVSEVEIDRFTGKTTVKQIDVLMDLGRSINEGLDQGQIAGAFVQCMGWVTNEELVYNEQGKLLSHSPTTYKIPNIQDIPEHFQIDLIDNPYNYKNIRGSKAVGEPPFVLGLSVWSAIRHALVSTGHKSMIPIPATAEKVLDILEREDG
jgi:xanthine dehydrogenase large subunit